MSEEKRLDYHVQGQYLELMFISSVFFDITNEADSNVLLWCGQLDKQPVNLQLVSVCFGDGEQLDDYHCLISSGLNVFNERWSRLKKQKKRDN